MATHAKKSRVAAERDRLTDAFCKELSDALTSYLSMLEDSFNEELERVRDQASISQTKTGKHRQYKSTYVPPEGLIGMKQADAVMSFFVKFPHGLSVNECVLHMEDAGFKVLEASIAWYVNDFVKKGLLEKHGKFFRVVVKPVGGLPSGFQPGRAVATPTIWEKKETMARMGLESDDDES